MWLDDRRSPPDDTWTWAKTAIEAIDLLRTGRVEEASLDHDLGHCDACTTCNGYTSPCGCECHYSGYFVVSWMRLENVWPKKKPTVHSRNPTGAAKIKSVIEGRLWGADE